jgi:rhodanese-related sulfurtransferase
MRRTWINFQTWLRSLFGKGHNEKTVQVEGGSYATIDVPTLQAMLKERPDSFLMVNTHIPFDGDIPGTDISIPYNRIDENLDKFPKDKHAEIVLYCMKDITSRIAAKQLVKAGYDNIKILVGGFVAWQDADLPLMMDETSN